MASSDNKEIAFLNANIRPFADGRTASAVLIRGGAVAVTGSDEEILRECGSGAEKADLHGKTVLPGFYDSHIHLMETSKIMDETWLGDVRSIDELVETGRRDAAERQSGKEWILGRGWNQENFPGKVYPTRYDLDKISTDRPILYQRCCGIVGVLNSKALEIAGIDENFSIPGGIVDKDENGKVTGVVRREALDGWVKKLLPKITQERARFLLKRMTEFCAAAGMTSAQSDDLIMVLNDVAFLDEAYSALAASGELSLRVGQQYLLRNMGMLRPFVESGRRTGDGGATFYTGPLKIIADGSLGSRTAALLSDYNDAPGTRGLYVHSDEELVEMMTFAHMNDLQMAIHSIGDAATSKVLGIIEGLQSKYGNPWRHRIVHCQIGNFGLYDKMAALGVNADVQAPFVASEWSWVGDRVGAEVEKQSYAWKSLLDRGIELGGSSDSPVEPFAPLWGVQVAVTRQDKHGRPEGGWLPEQRLSVEEALRMYTLGSATVCGEAKTKGTLETGKYGDMVVLDEDPFSVEPHEISSIPVNMTVMGGRVTFAR